MKTMEKHTGGATRTKSGSPASRSAAVVAPPLAANANAPGSSGSCGRCARRPRPTRRSVAVVEVRDEELGAEKERENVWVEVNV